MIVASDLDRTLIYSNRALAELGFPPGTSLKPVEIKEGKWVSYMTEASYALLQEIDRKYLFVPVTTRTTNQFNRIVIFQRDIPLSYAITANGACILKEGEPFGEWSEIIESKMKTDSAMMEEMVSVLAKEEFTFHGQIKKVEDYFFYYLLAEPLPAGERQSLHKLLSPFGWRVSLQGRKLYFIPQTINKGDALEFIRVITGAKAIAGSGDSMLDWDFLIRCRDRTVPNHGELAQEAESHGLLVTQKSGILAGEEILSHYLAL